MTPNENERNYKDWLKKCSPDHQLVVESLVAGLKDKENAERLRVANHSMLLDATRKRAKLEAELASLKNIENMRLALHNGCIMVLEAEE